MKKFPYNSCFSRNSSTLDTLPMTVPVSALVELLTVVADIDVFRVSGDCTTGVRGESAPTPVPRVPRPESVLFLRIYNPTMHKYTSKEGFDVATYNLQSIFAEDFLKITLEIRGKR